MCVLADREKKRKKKRRASYRHTQTESDYVNTNSNKYYQYSSDFIYSTRIALLFSQVFVRKMTYHQVLR